MTEIQKARQHWQYLIGDAKLRLDDTKYALADRLIRSLGKCKKDLSPREGKIIKKVFTDEGLYGLLELLEGIIYANHGHDITDPDLLLVLGDLLDLKDSLGSDLNVAPTGDPRKLWVGLINGAMCQHLEREDRVIAARLQDHLAAYEHDLTPNRKIMPIRNASGVIGLLHILEAIVRSNGPDKAIFDDINELEASLKAKGQVSRSDAA
jgi:hypothetical protein